MEGVYLDLVHRGRDLVVQHEVHDAVGIEVADADRADFPCPVQFLHGPPGAVNVAIGLVDQVEVEIVELKLVQRTLERCLSAIVTRVLNPQLGRDEQFPAVDAAVPDARTDRLFVHVRSGRVEQPVADVDGVPHAALALGRVRHLKDPEAQDWHLYAVV